MSKEIKSSVKEEQAGSSSKSSKHGKVHHTHSEHHLEISEKLHKIAFHLSKITILKRKMQQTFIGRQLTRVKDGIVHLFSELDKQPLIQHIVFTIVITLILETLSHRSLLKGIGLVYKNPIMFIYNCLIVGLSLAVPYFFRRKNFMFLIVFILWMWLGITNFILLGFRTTPLTAIDFHIFDSVFGIVHVYLNDFQLALISVVVLIVAIFVIYAFKKLPKSPLQIKNSFFTLCCTIVLLLGTSNLAVKAHAVTSDYGNLGQAFLDYGFAYCFTLSTIDRGISEPKEYSEENIEVVLDTIESNSSGFEEDEASPVEEVVETPVEIKPVEPTPVELANQNKNTLPNNDISNLNKIEEKIHPNIIFVQLESFIDVKRINKYTYSQDPVPYFTQLKNEFSSGYLTVPSIGAGTANTEFEIISGMSLDFFGAGEYPYKTILKETTTESICYDLDELGYHSLAMHNNTGTFYSRNKVFPNLGFDNFDSIEYMENVEYNPLGWAKDNVLTSEINRALKATEEQDFIYTISVQPHGKYPDKVIDDTQTITVTNEIDETIRPGFEYYLQQIHEEDQFIKSLLESLKTYDEPVVVVMYGDHLPSFTIENEDLDNGNKFSTEYVLWSNFDMEPVKKDVNAYQLSAYVLERLGYDNGILTKFHQNNAGITDYQEELNLLQYDMLYGDRNVYGGENPYIQKNMIMGISEITISDVELRGETLFVTGKNFTKWSEVYIDGSKKKTYFVDENTLIVAYDTLEDVERIEVAQVTDSDKVLSRSEAWFAHRLDPDGDFDEENFVN